MADPQLAALMAATLAKRKEKQPEEVVVEASGSLAEGKKATIKKKPPPGAQQLGMQAMLMQEAMKKDVKLKEAPKAWGVKQPELKKK